MKTAKIESALYQYSMNTVAVIKGRESLSDGDKIGVFRGDELRGIGEVVFIEPLNTHMAFITSYANENGEELSFAFYDKSQNEIVNLRESLTFDADDRIGRVTDPFIFSLESGSTNSGTLPIINTTPVIDAVRDLTVYPNPAQHRVFINLALSQEEDLQIEMTDLLGRVLQERAVRLPKGVSTLNWNTSSLDDGIYFLRFRSESGEMSKKIIIRQK